MSEEHYDWIELFFEKCGIVLSEYQNDRNILNKAILEEHLDDLIDTANKSGNISAHQTIAVLILQVGAELPNDLKEEVLESLEWENDSKRYHWPSYVVNVRKVYLEDFKRKILSYKSDNKFFLINLRRIQDDKELEKTLIGLEQLNSFSSLKTFGRINYINLESCELTNIPEDVFKFSNLSALSLDNNYLTTLPDSIKNLHCLRKLYLNNNDLKAIPDIFKTLKLSFFDLRNNPIKKIPVFLRERSRFKKVYSTEAFLSSLDK